MPKQKIEIEVELTDGFEVTGEYRAPLRGEWFICTGSFMALQCDDDGYSLARVILRKSYVPPSWAVPGSWLYKHGLDSDWSYSSDRPVESAYGGFRYMQGSKWLVLHSKLFPDFVPPPTNPYQIPEQK